MIFLHSLLIGVDKSGPRQGNLPRQTIAVFCDAGGASDRADDPLSAVRADGGGNRPVAGILGDAKLLVGEKDGIDPFKYYSWL